MRHEDDGLWVCCSSPVWIVGAGGSDGGLDHGLVEKTIHDKDAGEVQTIGRNQAMPSEPLSCSIASLEMHMFLATLDLTWA
jgi:hypothetical protein